MATQAIQRFKEEIAALGSAVERLQQRKSDVASLNSTVFRAMMEMDQKLVTAVDEGKPFIGSSIAYATEVCAAMNLPYYTLILPITTPGPVMEQQVRETSKIDIPTDVCTAIRLGMYSVEADLCPPPTAFVALISPCDGMRILHQWLQTKKDWANVPMFAPDPVYIDTERTLEYYAQEFGRMVSFLEEHTGHRLDIDRLREIVTESNKQYRLWSEFNELRRAIPCPQGYRMSNQVWLMVQQLWAGDPRCTDWLSELIAATEQRVREGKGPVSKERIRLFWYDIRPIWYNEFASWLENEYGAVTVMDMTSYDPYTPIDTSTKESMFRGLAKRGLYEMPMMRQELGPADHITADITRIVKDYRIDCVLWPGHMGHKAKAGAVGIGKETCRQLGVPFVHLGMDLFDSTYTTLDELKDTCAKAFSTMGLA